MRVLYAITFKHSPTSDFAGIRLVCGRIYNAVTVAAGRIAAVRIFICEIERTRRILMVVR